MMVVLTQAQAERLDNAFQAAADAARNAVEAAAAADADQNEEAEGRLTRATLNKVRAEARWNRALRAGYEAVGVISAFEWAMAHHGRQYRCMRYWQGKARVAEHRASPWRGDGRSAWAETMRGAGVPRELGRTVARMIAGKGAYNVDGLSGVAYWSQSDGIRITVLEPSGLRDVLTGELERLPGEEEESADYVGGLRSMHKGRAW